MSGTHVFYNGVLLRCCRTLDFSQHMVADDANNHLTSQFRIRVESLVFGFFNGEASPPSNESQLLSNPITVLTKNTGDDDTRGTATDRINTIYRLLKEPRKDFFFATHGGQREDIDESVYQIILAATGPDDLGTEGEPKYFKDVLGNDLGVRYIKNFSDAMSAKIKRSDVVDTKSGPTPIDVKITEFYGGKAFRVVFEIEVHRHLCFDQEIASDPSSLPWNLKPEENAKSNPFVLSNTWSSEEVCDDEFRRTQTLEGTLRVRDSRYIAQAFRYLCLPGLLPGYRRMSQRFASDPTNLVLKYRIEDKQAEAAPPAPAIDWEMKHVDTSKNEFGMVERQLFITLTGLPKCNKSDLAGAAIRLLDNRFPNARLHGQNFKAIAARGVFVTGMIISHTSKSPSIELFCNVRQHVAGIGGFENAVGASLLPITIAGYSPDSWPIPKPFDKESPAGIFACYAQRPCSPWHGMPQSQELDLGGYSTTNTPPVVPTYDSGYWQETGYAEYVAAGPSGGAPLGFGELVGNIHRDEQITLPYQFFETETRYVIDPGLITLPLSKPRVTNMTQEIEGIVRTLPRTQTCVNIPIHSGVMYREITIKGTRHGAPVEFPEPAAILIDPNGVVETLVGKQTMLLDSPKASDGQQHRIFTAQAKFRYVLDRPLTLSERYRMGNDVSLLTGPDDNRTFGAAIFGRGRIEHHGAVIPASPGSEVVSEVRQPTIDNVTVGQPIP